MIELALATQIPMSEWASAGERAVFTAIEVLEEQQRKNGSDGRRYSG